MPRRLVSLALVLVGWSAGPCIAGDSFNNGGGLAEADITYVGMMLESYLQTCLAIPSCGADARDLVAAIAAAAPAERAASLPRFQTAAAVPGFFDDGPIERVFRTAPRVGAPVVYNLDRIYRRDPASGRVQPLGVGDALALVFEAMSLHQGRAVGDAEVARLAARLKELSDGATTAVHFGGQGEEQIYAQIVTLTAGAKLLVCGGQDLVDVTPDFPGTVTGFGNLRFGDLQAYGGGIIRLPLRGRANGRDFALLLYFKVDPTTRAMAFDHDEVRW